MRPSEKLERLNRLASSDARHPALRALADDLWRAATAAGDPHRAYLQLIHTVARDWVRYETDTQRVGHEDIAGMTRQPENPLTVLWRGWDDCDAKARLFVALARARGIVARVEGEVVGDELTHVWPEYWDGRWMPAETTLARARLGDVPRQVPKERNGQWLYS